MTISSRHFKINGMHCPSCEDTINEAVSTLPGVLKVNASYRQAKVDVDYDETLLDETRLHECLAAKGYPVQTSSESVAGRFKYGLIFILLLVMVGGVAFWGKSQMPSVMQQISPQMSQALLFGIGVMTGFHCIGMCGGFVVGYTDVRQPKVRQLLGHLSYAFGKTLSYTTLGAGFGLLGATIAITPQIRGGVALASSVFLLIYGLKMLNVFSALRRFTLRLPAGANREIASQLRKHRSPLMTGLLTGLLLGCGPLQAMYVMAAGSGDPVQGGLILLLFGLGTLLPLLGFGFFASLLSHGVIRQLVRVSGILVFAMGIMMAQRGMMLLKGGQMNAMTTQSIQQPH
jgi:sulfite exporter TauE/SafE/copper chaperone CopZ